MEYQAIATSGGDVIILLAPNTESLKIWVISKLHTKASRSPNYDVDGDITEGAGGCGGSFGSEIVFSAFPPITNYISQCDWS